MKITKQKVQAIADLKAGYTLGHADVAILNELARIALASLEAEPVAYIFKHPAGRLFWALTDESNKGQSDVMPVYTAPPAPASMPDEDLLHMAASAIDDLLSNKDRSGAVVWADIPAKLRRAAMLQGAESRPELTVWYGSMLETNGKTNWIAMLHRKGQHPWDGITIECSGYPDRVRYEADRMRHLIGELSEEPDILEYDSEAHSGYVKPGNSPVIPDGWVACSERMPENKPGSYEYLVFESLNNGVHHDYWNVPDVGDDCQFTPFWNHYDRYVTHWMALPAAPLQEDL